MSISFNTDGHNIEAIQAESRLANMLTKYRYLVYGLVDDGDSEPIMIKAGRQVPLPALQGLQALFVFNHAPMSISHFKKPRSDFKVYIGLRRDLRDQIALCGAILQTIVYSVEGRTVIDPLVAYTLPGIPKMRSKRKR